MKSKLNKIEFELRLHENIKIGLPKLKLSIFSIFTAFGENSKPFYGLFDNSNFNLTKNNIIFPTYLILRGKYDIEKGIIKVNYKIEPSSKFHIYWMKFFPFIFIMIFNLFFFLTENRNFQSYILIHIFIAFIYFYSKWKSKIEFEKFEQNFREIFEIIE